MFVEVYVLPLEIRVVITMNILQILPESSLPSWITGLNSPSLPLWTAHFSHRYDVTAVTLNAQNHPSDPVLQGRGGQGPAPAVGA